MSQRSWAGGVYFYKRGFNEELGSFMINSYFHRLGFHLRVRTRLRGILPGALLRRNGT